MPMGPPGRQFPPTQGGGINSGWPPQQQQSSQQQQQSSQQQQHQIPPQHSHYPPNHAHHQQQQLQQHARLRFSSMPGTSNNPNIQNPVSAIHFARSGIPPQQPQRPPAMTTSSTSHPIITKPLAKKLKNPPTIDKEKIQTWHDFPADKRQLKKHRYAADVFPQESQQEEDKMTPELNEVFIYLIIL
jgi:hypothetical protein